MTVVLKEEKTLKRETHGECCVVTRAEAGARQLQAQQWQDCGQFPEAWKQAEHRGTDSPLELPEVTNLTNTSILDFQASRIQKNKFLLS